MTVIIKSQGFAAGRQRSQRLVYDKTSQPTTGL